MSGQSYEQRQIFRARVDFSDGSGAKERPVLIISNNTHNKSNQDLICCPITSKPNGEGRMIMSGDYEIEKNKLPVPQSEIKSKHPLCLNKCILIPLNNRIKIKRELAEKIIKDIKDIIENK